MGKVHARAFPDVDERVEDAVQAVVIRVVDVYIGHYDSLFELFRCPKHCKRVLSHVYGEPEIAHMPEVRHAFFPEPFHQFPERMKVAVSIVVQL